MPRLVLSNDQVMVYDDFLPNDVFESLLEYVAADTYAFVHKNAWSKVWRLGDGLPLLGTTTVYRIEGAAAHAEEIPRYPTRTPVDAFIEALDGVADDAAALVGKRGTTWTGICVTPFLHPRGSGLSMHRDREVYTGSFTYYVHRRWKPHWGGHLLVLDPRTGAGRYDNRPRPPSFLTDEHENELVSEPGLALCVLPRPNRLVFLTESAYHMVTRVDADAGDRPRTTLAGFFLPPVEG